MDSFFENMGCCRHSARAVRLAGWTGLAVLLTLTGCDKPPSRAPAPARLLQRRHRRPDRPT
jgi:hypothetical protein